MIQGVVWTVGEGFEDELIEAPIGTGLVGETAHSGRLINCCTGECSVSCLCVIEGVINLVDDSVGQIGPGKGKTSCHRQQWSVCL